MPIVKNNQGFGYLPILAISALVLTVTYFGYSWYTNNSKTDLETNLSTVVEENNNTEEDVLQAADIYRPADVTSFLFNDLFGSRNLTDFNKATNGLILGSSSGSDFDSCVFAPRSSRPLTGNVNYQGKAVNLKVYQNVEYQKLPKVLSQKKYMVVSTNFVANQNSQLRFVYEPIPNNCKPNVFIFEQPSNTVNLNDLVYFSENAAFIELVAYKEYTQLYIQRYGQTSSQDWDKIREAIRVDGLNLLFNNKSTLNIKPEITCPKGCENGIEIKIPHRFYVETNSGKQFLLAIYLPQNKDEMSKIKYTARFQRTCGFIENGNSLVYGKPYGSNGPCTLKP